MLLQLVLDILHQLVNVRFICRSVWQSQRGYNGNRVHRVALGVRVAVLGGVAIVIRTDLLRLGPLGLAVSVIRTRALAIWIVHILGRAVTRLRASVRWIHVIRGVTVSAAAAATAVRRNVGTRIGVVGIRAGIVSEITVSTATTGVIIRNVWITGSGIRIVIRNVGVAFVIGSVI